MAMLVSGSPQEALSTVVMRCLAKRDQLYLDWLIVLEQSGTYQGGWVDEQDLREKALEAYALILRRIAGFEIGEALSTISDRVGARRAEQGVSLAEVQAAANLNFKVVWNALLSEATVTEREALLGRVPDIWAAVDEHTQRISWAYTRRRDELDRLSGDRRREWFSRLLKCDGERPEVVERAADVLEFDSSGRFRVVVAPRACAAELRTVRDTLKLLRWSVHHQEVDVGDLLVVQTPQASDERLLNTLAGLRCAVAPPSFGLDEVPRATRIASDVLSVLPPERSQPAFLEDAWFTVAASQASLVAHTIRSRIDRSLEGVPDADALLHTARVYCDKDGVIAQAARELFCHRNTVLNRLERLRDLTGYDVRTPRDAAAFLFAMAARI